MMQQISRQQMGSPSRTDGSTPEDSTNRPIPGKIMYTDGLCEPKNPGGYGCYGWIAYEFDGRTVAQNWGTIGHGDGMTNNIAEYWALLFALDFAKSQGWTHVRIRTDSKLVVEQVNGRWACKAPSLQHLHTEAQRLVTLTRATLEWVPRGQNMQADALSRRAYAEARRSSAPAARGGVG